MTSPTDREARERGRYIERTTDLNEREARTAAYSKLGFSASGVSKRTGYSEGTIKTYLERVAVAYGFDTAYTPTLGNRDDDLNPVTEDEVMALPDETRQWWLSTAADHPDIAPDWAHDLLEEGGEA
jgi:DNA-binding CsgD family transcriptional regulator